MRIYSTSDFERDYRSNVPAIYACLTAITFSLLIAFFYVYDFMVRLRNMKMIDGAARSNAIVTSMFPDAIRDKLLRENDGSALIEESTTDYGGSSRILGGRTKV